MWNTIKGFLKVKKYYIITKALNIRFCPILKYFRQISKARFMISETMLLSTESFYRIEMW